MPGVRGSTVNSGEPVELTAKVQSVVRPRALPHQGCPSGDPDSLVGLIFRTWLFRTIPGYAYR